MAVVLSLGDSILVGFLKKIIYVCMYSACVYMFCLFGIELCLLLSTVCCAYRCPVQCRVKHHHSHSQDPSHQMQRVLFAYLVMLSGPGKVVHSVTAQA